MSRELTIWLLIFAVGAITYTARLSFIALFARRDMPPLLAEALKHVPVAMVTAIVVPAVVFMPPGVLRIDPANAASRARRRRVPGGRTARWRRSVGRSARRRSPWHGRCSGCWRYFLVG
jgi:uncharacterized membrane protein